MRNSQGLGGKLETQRGEIKLESTFASGSVLIVGGSRLLLNASVKGHPRGEELEETTQSQQGSSQRVGRKMFILVLETVHITK